MGVFGWLFDQNRCIECRACEAACKQWNGVDTGFNVRYRRVSVYESGKFPDVSADAVSMACNHCDNPLCLKVCPVKAITRRADGIVLINQAVCVGCGFCAKFCPYHAPQLHLGLKKMQKCTMCADRIDAGMEPACSTMCPTGALQWGAWDKIQGQGVDRIPNVSPPDLTRPSIRYIADTWEKA